MPFPVRSSARMSKTCGHVLVNAINGRAADDSAYPPMTIGRRRVQRSDAYPETILSRLLIASATPSMMPRERALAPITRNRYTGSSG